MFIVIFRFYNFFSLGRGILPRNRRKVLLQSEGHLEAPTASSHFSSFLAFFLDSLVQLWIFSSDFSRPPLRGCLPKSCATHCFRDVIDPGLFLSCGAEVASRLPCAESRGMSLLTADRSTCCGLARDSPLPCGQSQRSVSTA